MPLVTCPRGHQWEAPGSDPASPTPSCPVCAAASRQPASPPHPAEPDAVASLQHPNVVQVYDIGEAQGRAYFSMEYIDGGTLAQHLGTRPPPRQAAQLVATLARAVHHAHEKGIVHRDLKPANVLLASP